MAYLSSLVQGPAEVWLLAAIAFLCGFFEGFAIPFPGSWVLAVLGGAFRHTAWRLTGFAVLAAVGYTLGAGFPYWLGSATRHWGLPAASGRFGLTPARLAQLQALFRRYGEPAVLWSRPLWIGNFVSIPAGMAAMPIWRFSLYTFIGILPWALAILWLGNAAGALLEQAGTWAAWAAAAVALGGLVLWWWRQRRHRLAGVPDETD